MVTTYFRPSIHGWPFGNSFDLTIPIPFGEVELTNRGFCGGMCWTALQRFYEGILIPRNTPAPRHNSELYNEILGAQLYMMSPDKLWKIYNWQSSPDKGHWNRKHSLGYRTQQEWPNVRSRLNQSRPVTLTLIVHSNSYDPTNLDDTHRVVAYAYESRPVIEGEGAPPKAHTTVTVSIYDPNYPNCDDVQIKFYLGGQSSNIRIRHNKGMEVHGFFLDEPIINYLYSDNTTLHINKCEQAAISSATLADYHLEFSWQCRFIPYFCILIDDVAWNYNDVVMQTYEPKTIIHKQCPTRLGTMSLNIKLPRTRSKVSVCLLDTDVYTVSKEIDATPYFECYPYVNQRSDSNHPFVCDTILNDSDVYIKDPKPTQFKIRQLDNSPFRWIMVLRPGQVNLGQVEIVFQTRIKVMDDYRLGNIVVPVCGNFIEKNLALPTVTWGSVKIKNGDGQIIHSENFYNLASEGQRIFDGFRNNPTDYNNDTTVEFTYASKDKFGVIASGVTIFYGRSIIYRQLRVAIQQFDSAKIAKFEKAAYELVERGLIDRTIKLPDKEPYPQPLPIDPFDFKKRIDSDRSMQKIISQNIRGMFNVSSIWKDIWKVQSKNMNQTEPYELTVYNAQSKQGDMLTSTNNHRTAEQDMYDSTIVSMFADKVVEKLSKNSIVNRRLTAIKKDLEKHGKKRRRPSKIPIK